MPTALPVKRRDAKRSRLQILGAAQDCFAQNGYRATGIREIAARAGVNSALVARYFGSKAALFAEALASSVPQFDGMDLRHDGFGVRLVERYLQDGLDTRALRMIAASAGDPEAAQICATFMENHAIAPLAQWLGPPDARARAVRITMLSTSFMLYTRQVALMTPTEAEASQTGAWLAQTLQAIIDDSRRQRA